MIAYITSTGEKTTGICRWSLERNGFKTIVVSGDDSLASKLKRIYTIAEDDFLRVDADVIPNKNLNPEILEKLKTEQPDIYWWQFTGFDWFKQDIGVNGICYVREEALKPLREHVDEYLEDVRPETRLARIPEFYSPRRMETYHDIVMGLHGYATSDLEPVKELKAKRKQTALYDFELAEKINEI